MSENKPEQLELDQLLQIAKTPTKEKIIPINDYSDAYQFALEFKLEQGEHEVPAILLYTLYTRWKKKDLATKTRFFRDFKQYFLKKKKAKGVFYLMNNSALDIEKIIGDKIDG